MDGNPGPALGGCGWSESWRSSWEQLHTFFLGTPTSTPTPPAIPAEEAMHPVPTCGQADLFLFPTVPACSLGQDERAAAHLETPCAHRGPLAPCAGWDGRPDQCSSRVKLHNVFL